MILAELDPVINANNVLIFDCPNCRDHRIRVPLSPTGKKLEGGPLGWGYTGDLSNLTLDPSVNAGCWHGHIENGVITP